MRKKRKVKPSQSPLLRDVTWAAGIYEGEGNCEGRRSGRTTEYISVTQKDKWLLYRLRRLWGGSIWTNKRSCSRWYLTGEDAREFMNQILPYLSPRRVKQWASKTVAS